MSRPARVPARCVGSPSFSPDEIIANQDKHQKAREHLAQNNLYEASRALLGFPAQDSYVYHATASVKLAEVQKVVNFGGVNGLHAWYRNEDGTPVSCTASEHQVCLGATTRNHRANGRQRDPPSQPDIEAYISIFSPSTVTASSLKNFATNAKKGSIRAEAAEHLTNKRYIHDCLSSKLTIPKSKKPTAANPYYDFWAWSCRNLEWCGPCASSERTATSHHVLPIFMHHFGCATPSHEALEVLRILADGRDLADIGSGNGYWTLLLRNYGLTVHAVDNMQSEWRVNWINDTIITDGIQWLRKSNGGKDIVLLLVYPVVGGGLGGGTEGCFTRDLVSSFKGDTLAVVGTQNKNGYTGFKNMTMDDYMAKEHKDWTKTVQIPLPSFAGKDEALYVFQRGSRAPPEGE